MNRSLAHLIISSGLSAVIVSALIAVPLLYGAHAQEQSIMTSADEHWGIFFGEGVLQVVVTDPDAENDSTIEDLVVDIEANPDSGSQGSVTVTVPETSESSGRFEFYMAHESATSVGPDDIDAINSRGVEGDSSCVLACAPFVTFGPSADLQVDADLYEDIAFDINSGGSETRILYEENLSEIELDRNAYGSDSFVYVFILDQDANLNPSNADEFEVDPANPPNADLLELSGGAIVEAVTFRETGDNTARFEGRYELGASMTFEFEALALTLFDKANYNATLAADENDSNSSDEVSFTIGDSDGTIDVGGDAQTWDAKLTSDKTVYSLGESIMVMITDPDANADPGIVEVLEIEASTSNGTAVIEAAESGPNTGVFEATFMLGFDGAIAGAGIYAVSGESLVVSYIDQKPADYAERLQSGQDPEKDFAIEIRVRNGEIGIPAFVTPPEVTGPLTVGTQLALSTIIEYNGNSSQPFFVLIEVRDSAGITLYLAWQSGMLVPEGSSSIEVSWTPEAAAEYELRSFAVSSLEEGSVITEVARSVVTVS